MSSIFYKKPLSTEQITAQTIAKWQAEYGEDLCKEEFEGKFLYLRPLSDREIAKIIKAVSRPKLSLDFKAYIRCAIKEGFLGGNAELLTDTNFHNKLYSLWLM